VYSTGFNMGRHLDELSVFFLATRNLYHIIVLLFYVIGEYIDDDDDDDLVSDKFDLMECWLKEALKSYAQFTPPGLVVSHRRRQCELDITRLEINAVSCVSTVKQTSPFTCSCTAFKCSSSIMPWENSDQQLDHLKFTSTEQNRISSNMLAAKIRLAKQLIH